MDITLTNTEEELMLILWDIKEGSIRDIMSELPASRDLAYTSVSTIIRILEKKGAVTSTKVGRGHVYAPALSRTDYQTASVNNLVEGVFKDAPVSVVKCLIEQKKITDKDKEELLSLLKDLK